MIENFSDFLKILFKLIKFSLNSILTHIKNTDNRNIFKVGLFRNRERWFPLKSFQNQRQLKKPDQFIVSLISYA